MDEVDFSQCLVLNTRMAARAITRRYDRKLRPFGITAAQFSVLTAIRGRPERSVTEMAQVIAMDRTTLSRNLDLLEKKGLIACRPADKGNGRLCTLTEPGSALVETLIPKWVEAQAELLPLWREAQTGLRSMQGQPELSDIIQALQQLAKL